MTRLWFNRTYATNAHVIAMLRANPAGRAIHVIGTHVDPDSPVLAVCDEAYPEPERGGPDYVEWALGFAREHAVDVLVPRAHMAELAEARAAFAGTGTRLMCAGADTVRLFEHKPSAFRAAAELGLPVAPFRVVTGGDALREAHEQLRGLAGQVCVKPVRGVGGDGYRVLTTGPRRLEHFTGRPRARADLDAYCAALDAAQAAGETVPQLLVMPFLEGPEVSVDTLATEAGEPLAAIGRGHGRRRVLLDDAPARDVATTLVRGHRVAFLANTQVRYWRGPGDATARAYLLELNTRISGGLFQTAFADVNLPWEALRLALGEDVGPLKPRFGAAFATLTCALPLR